MELLLARLREAQETRRVRMAEADAARDRGVLLVGQLRDRGVDYRVIRDQGDVPLGTAYSWAERYEREQGRTGRPADGEDEQG